MSAIARNRHTIDNGDEPVSWEQEALFCLFEKDGASATRNAHVICDVGGHLDAGAVGTALDLLIERHPMLSTVYTRRGSTVWQHVQLGVTSDFEVVDTGTDAECVNALLANAIAAPFDLEKGPIFRARLFLRGNNNCSLLLCTHQIAADHDSLRILLRDFEAIYTSNMSGASLELPALPTTYFGYARPQQKLTAETARVSLEFWCSRLPDDEVVLDLPLDRVRPPEFDGRSSEFHFEAPEALSRALLSLADKARSDAVSVCLTAWMILLNRYCGVSNVPLALLTTCRDTPWLKDVVGNFSNQVFITADCEPQLSFTELLQQVSLTARMALEHRKLPLGFLLREFDVEPRSGRGSLCDVCFAWEEPLRTTGEISGMPFNALADIPLPPSGFDLGLRAHRAYGTAGRLNFSLAYRPDLFERASIERMSRHFLRLLESVAASPEAAVSSLELIPEDERQLIFGVYAGATEPFPQQCLHELFAEQAARTPGAEALVFHDKRVTYSELDHRSTLVARFLRAQGLRREEPVGILMPGSIDMIVSIIGILKAGGVYAPIDPTYPPERIEFIVRDMNARWILTHGTPIVDLPAGAAFVNVDEEGFWRTAKTEGRDLGNQSSPESPAALIYTSGSTGKPKGVLIPHRSIVRAVRDTNYLTISPSDRVGQAMSPSFDVCALEMWSALTNGAALVGLRDTLLSPMETACMLRAEAITVLFIPTAYLHQIGRETPDLLRNLRVVLFGGEAAEPAPIRRILLLGPPRELINCYGPAEGGIIASFHRITPMTDDSKPVPIGRPVSNVRIHIVDAGMRPVPLGVRGEICIGGEISCGYRNRPDLNRQKFVADTISGIASENPGARLYRTGDLGRLRENGQFEFMGRADRQVKLRGYRIELSEVEIALASHPDVRTAVAMIHEQQLGIKRLVACVTLRRSQPRISEILREYAATRLPQYMVPAAIAAVEKMPLTPNGKIDREALEAVWLNSRRATFEAPATALERAVAHIWEGLLPGGPVGGHDNFFDSGGDSLSGMRLIVAIRELFGIDLPLRVLFDTADLSSFCAALQSCEQYRGQLEKIAPVAAASAQMQSREQTPER